MAREVRVACVDLAGLVAWPMQWVGTKPGVPARSAVSSQLADCSVPAARFSRSRKGLAPSRVKMSLASLAAVACG